LTEKQTVAGAYAKIEAHEDICALRYKGIGDSIKELKDLIHWILAGVAMVAVSLIAWMAVQLFAANNARMTALEAHPAAVVGK
jgi:hypothetical protein